MWPFGKKKIDLDDLGLELLRESAKYLKPTVDVSYAYLEESGQLQYREEMTEKRILNLAGAVAVVELVLRQSSGDRGDASRNAVLEGFYNSVRRLADQSFGEHQLRLSEGRTLVEHYVTEAIDKYRQPASEPQQESLAYEIARTVLRLHLQWSSSNGELLELPTAAANWRELSQAGDGLARSQRWIEQSLGKQIRSALA